MLTFEFSKPRDRGIRILCVGAHSDYIEIGCGGTILRLLSEHRDAEAFKDKQTFDDMQARGETPWAVWKSAGDSAKTAPNRGGGSE